ncbi:MAG TPA: HPr family phosphocarrier protein [Cellulomonas sp.]
MVQRTAVVASRVGLHARPAKILTTAAASGPAKVTIGRPDGPAVDAASILLVMSLGIRCGEQVVLTAVGDGAEARAAVDALAAVVETDHDEPAGSAPAAGSGAAAAGTAGATA